MTRRTLAIVVVTAALLVLAAIAIRGQGGGALGGLVPENARTLRRTLMTTNTVALVVAIALSGSVPAGGHHAHAFQDKKTDQKAAPGVAGRWTMSVKGGPHGDATMGLALEQKGKQVSGTFATPHGDDLQVQGEFAEGT